MKIRRHLKRKTRFYPGATVSTRLPPAGTDKAKTR
ncbi:hypothetical protein EVA_09933 [gut metagenome]|uniref:Uncharacterized protein n=1 Tax=gut metagenome TaxID=749906 RepID=J9GIZ1_9ZZZZ